LSLLDPIEELSDMQMPDLPDLTRRFGTPFFYFDGDAIEDRARRFRRALSDRVDLFFALKSNPLLAIVQLIARQGIGADISSGGEWVLAQAAGVPPQQTAFCGPGKSTADIELAVQGGVRWIHCESLEEARRIQSVGSAAGRRVPIALRINPEHAPNSPEQMVGGTQFGVELRQAPAVINQIRELPNVELCGFHFFLGGGGLDPAEVTRMMQANLELSCRLSRDCDLRLRYVGLGGGLGTPRWPAPDAVDVEPQELAHRINALIESQTRALGLESVAFSVEFGRYFIQPFGLYVARVMDVKLCSGKHFVVLDGGSNHLIMPAVMQRNYYHLELVRSGRPRGEGASITADVVGPLCFADDRLGYDVSFDDPRPGDLLLVHRTGAYGSSMSPGDFIGHRRPPELMQYGGRLHVARQASNREDVLTRQVPLADFTVAAR
jgi:diaminopimelate decarboxylase